MAKGKGTPNWGAGKKSPFATLPGGKGNETKVANSKKKGK